MTPETIAAIRHDLPETAPFPYFADRESAWLLANQMPANARVSALKAGPLAGLLQRPAVRPLVAACGGELAREDVRAVAKADGGTHAHYSTPALAGLLASFDLTWSDFELSFTSWGEDEMYFDVQLSRGGGNLVVQLGFPSDHAALIGAHLRDVGARARDLFVSPHHPVRLSGRPTLAWARIDVEDGVALIEEVQSDWLRIAKDQLRELENHDPRSRHLKGLRAYEAAVHARYAALWPRAIMLAALVVITEHLEVRDIFMHQPDTGVLLKHIQGAGPPSSLYTTLPKRFGFQPTNEVPPFLKKVRKRDLARLRRPGGPVFWRLQLEDAPRPA